MAGPVRSLAALLFMCELTCFVGGGAQQPVAQQPIGQDAGCTRQKDEYTCNWSRFLLAFDRSHTVAIETGAMDRPAGVQVRRLVAELGKVPTTPGETADLTFTVAPVPPNGVDFGPSDHDLARLLVSAPTVSNAHGVLLWAETYRGQGDRPWPAQVQALLSQFKGSFAAHR